MTSLPALLRMAGSALLAFVLACSAAAASPPLVLGSYAYPGLDRTDALRPLAALVSRTAGRPVAVKLYADPEQVAHAVRKGKIDVAVLNLGAWLMVAGDPHVRPLAVLAPSAAVLDRYRAVLLARPGSDVASLEDIIASTPRLSIAAVLPGSTSGGLVQNAAIGGGNRTVQWRSVIYTGSHEAALVAVATGSADVAAVAEAPWRAWLDRQTTAIAQPREVWRSSPLPAGPVVCRSSGRLDCAALGAALIRNTPEARRAAHKLARGWPESAGARRFHPYDPARYSGLIAAGSLPLPTE